MPDKWLDQYREHCRGSPGHSEGKATWRAAFVASLEAAIAEGERDGFFTIEQVDADCQTIIAAARARQVET